MYFTAIRDFIEIIYALTVRPDTWRNEYIYIIVYRSMSCDIVAK